MESLVRRGPGLYEGRWRPPQDPAPHIVRIRVDAPGQPAVAHVELELLLPSIGPRAGRVPRRWFWTAAAATGIVLVSGLVMRGVALRQSDEYKDPGTSLDRRHELKDSGERWTTASSALLGVGAGLALGTAVLGYFSFRAERPRRGAGFALSPLPGGGAVVGLREMSW